VWHNDVIIGGKEGVLVFWQLDTGKKKFLPRIGSPLRYFIDSPDPSFSSVRLTFVWSNICLLLVYGYHPTAN
jgi:hypothetical protein